MTTRLEKSKKVDIDDVRNLKDACDPFYTISDVIRDIVKGALHLYRALDRGVHIGSFCVRVEEYEGGRRELVVVVAGGRSSVDGKSLFQQFMPHTILLAQKYQCGSIRAHTNSKAVGRMMEGAGYEVAEYVYRAVA
jgi:hypothetical protein